MQVPVKAPLPPSTEVMATPSHIVVLFNATAGKNGEDVGVDEEQIVLFVYLLYDVTNNKVVAVQSHYVRPQPNELSETLLTEDCKTETGLDEEAIKNSQPLEHVLDEFDRFLSAKGVHPNHGGKSFCLCMDGPAHLRQCIHAEASNKNIQLAQYFYKFFDIRKEFKKFYKANHITCIKGILEYLGLEADQSVEYGIRQCQEMAKIIQRLINDGHVFSQPDIVSERLEPGICSKNEHVDDSTVVRARGLPWQSSDQDIARFFKGLNIARGGVALCLSQQGRRNGEALIRFENEENRDLALKRHKHHIGQRYIEVYKASGKDFVNVAGGCNTEAQIFLSRGGQAIIRMRGLPFTATTQHVLEFFARDPNAVTVLDGEDGILFVHYPDGRATGDAFVLFSTEDEANRAIKKHREMMGSRYIELFKSTTAEVQQVLNRSMDPRVPDQPEAAQITPLITQLPQQTSVPLVPQNMITSGTRKDCIRLRHLPNGAQVTDILTFLAEFSQFIVYQGVHMVYNAQGEPSGEAFIQMDSEESAQLTSLNRHRKPMIFSNKKRIIDVIQCSGEDMSLVLTNGYPTAVTFQQPTTPVVQRPIISPNLALMGQTMKSPLATQIPEVPIKHSISPVFPSPGSNPIIPTGLTSPFSYAAQLSQLSQLSQPLPGAFPSPLTHIPQRPAYYPSPILYWYPSPPVSPQSYYTQAQTGPAVVVMRGLPFNASIQDILAFFQSYPEVGPESIQIQQNTDGRPNGDALVTFASRSEAERAIAERNRQNIGNRYIELFLAERAAV